MITPLPFYLQLYVQQHFCLHLTSRHCPFFILSLLPVVFFQLLLPLFHQWNLSTTVPPIALAVKVSLDILIFLFNPQKGILKYFVGELGSIQPLQAHSDQLKGNGWCVSTCRYLQHLIYDNVTVSYLQSYYVWIEIISNFKLSNIPYGKYVEFYCAHCPAYLDGLKKLNQ